MLELLNIAFILKSLNPALNRMRLSEMTLKMKETSNLVLMVSTALKSFKKAKALLDSQNNITKT
jgi:hypothetical protein